MRILLSNDDGIDASGMRVLAEKLAEYGHSVLVVAPKGNRSGFSHSVTFRQKLCILKDNSFNNENITAYSTSGTPADCVKFAMHKFKDYGFEIVVSGINNGSNMGADILYSGTVGAASEGAFYGYPAIAFSNSADFDNLFDDSADIAVRIIELLTPYLKCASVFNVNIPNIKKQDVKGIVFTKAGVQLYNEEYIKLDCEEEAYSLGGEAIDHDNNDANADVEVVRQKYVSITPLKTDRTNHKVLKELTEMGLGLKL